METTLDTTYAANYLAICNQLATQSMAFFQSRWKHIPEDKMNWTPGGKAKSPIQIGAHVAVSNEMFARSLMGKPPVEGGIPEIFAWMHQEESKITTREEVESRLNSSIAEFSRATTMLPAEVVAGSPDAQFYLGLAGRHIMGHASQLDTYQLIWGDEDFHFEG